MRQTLHFSNTYNLKASAGTVLKPGIVPLWYIITMWLMVPEEWFLPQAPKRSWVCNRIYLHHFM